MRGRSFPAMASLSATFTMKQRLPPFKKNPFTAWERAVLFRLSAAANSVRNCDQLLTATASPGWAAASGACPTKAALLVEIGVIVFRPACSSI